MGLFSSRNSNFDPERDIHDLSGKIIIVTGGNNGLGKESILQLAKHHPEKIYMGARSETKAKAAIDEVKQIVPEANISFLELDLSSFASVKKAAQSFLSENDRLDILLNNAGVVAPAPGLTEEGYEVNFGTNHMGTALFTKLLLPVLQRTADSGHDVRMVILSSALYSSAPEPGILFEQNKSTLKDVSTFGRYGQSKLANHYFSKALAERYPAIKSVSLHPGLVRTSISDDTKKSSFLMLLIHKVAEFFISVDVPTGTLNQLWACTSSSVKSGEFYFPVGKETHAKLLDDKNMADKLWEWTEQELSVHGY